MELEEGSCVDVLVTDNDWQLGIIESVNKSTREIKVSLTDGMATVFSACDVIQCNVYWDGQALFAFSGWMATELHRTPRKLSCLAAQRRDPARLRWCSM